MGLPHEPAQRGWRGAADHRGLRHLAQGSRHFIRNNGWVVETHYLHLILPPPLKPPPVLLICH
jgi:hypothetical protein